MITAKDEDIRFRRACDKMKGPAEPIALQDAALAFTEMIQDRENTSAKYRRLSLWKRGECQQRMGLHADDLSEVVALYESARHDFLESVKTEPDWFAEQMESNHWFPQHPTFLPAYITLLAKHSDDLRDSTVEFAVLSHAVNALGSIGTEASETLPALEAAKVCGIGVRLQIELAIPHISTPGKHQDADYLSSPFVRVSDYLNAYPSKPSRSGYEFTDEDYDEYFDEWFVDQHRLTESDLTRSEPELLTLLSDNAWGFRAKAACILRCMIKKPQAETVRSLLEHLGPNEICENVRGQCAWTLDHFASEGAIDGETLERFITELIERLDTDTAHSVRSIAAESLGRFGWDRPDIVEALMSALSKPQNLNLQRALVKALGDCGHAAAAALPLVLKFEPSKDDKSGDVIKAAAILRIAPTDHPLRGKAFGTFADGLRNQPICNSTHHRSRERRTVALKTILNVPMPESLRLKLLLERLYFDERADLRCNAARTLIRMDKDLATKAGAYLVLDRIGCR